MQMKVHLNGTDTNPFYPFGLTQNPFTQIARTEYQSACLRMQKLGGDPIPPDRAPQYIRETLAGFSEEFILLCISAYVPGKYVEILVRWPD